MATNSQLSHMSAVESLLGKKRKLQNERQLETNENPIQFLAQTQHTPTPGIQSSPNVCSTFTTPTPLLLQQICLTRSQLEKLENNFVRFEDFKQLLKGCFVRIMFWGHYLAEAIHDVDDCLQIENKIRVGRRVFLPRMGYYEFKQVNATAPMENEIQGWMDRHKSQLPSVEFVWAKIAELQKALNTVPIPPISISTKLTRSQREKDNINDIANLVHNQEMLIRTLLPSHKFLEFLKLREKFPERVNMTIGCWVAYKIRDDPNGRVYVSRISSILRDNIHFKHRQSVKIDQLLPVVENEAIDEDAFGNWLEDMDNWKEQLPSLKKDCGKKCLVADTIRRTLQQGPPIESENRPITWKDLVIRSEDFGVLLTGLDQQEFRQIISGMFVYFDFGNTTMGGSCVFKISSLSSGRAFNMRGHWALPIAYVTFEPNISQHSLPFLPPHLCSNAFLHVDPQFIIQCQIENNISRITSLPIPQNRELIRHDYSWEERRTQLKYNPPSHEFIKFKVQQFWQALERAKRVPFKPCQAIVLPVPKLPAQESTEIPVIQL